MARPRKTRIRLRSAPALGELANMSDDDLEQIATKAPGDVVTSDSPTPWHASPSYCVVAARILSERETAARLSQNATRDG